MKQKILFIPWIFNPKWYQNIWRREAHKNNFELIEFENPFYSYFSIKQMEKMIGNWVKIIKKNKNEDLVIVCHSFWWILLNCILQKINHWNIKKIIILASPLQMNHFWMKKRKLILWYDENFDYNTKIRTFWWYIDIIVPFMFTNYKNEKHKNVLWWHMFFLISKKFINKILNKI